jgi:hygromycin-B 7''-O-kinase
MPLLPEIKTAEEYRSYFSNDKIWEPVVRAIQKRHGLSGEFQRSTRGSHIVYRLGDQWLKIMTPIFAGDMAFEVAGLRSVEGKLSVKTPALLAEGEIEGWSYILCSHVPGKRIGDVWKELGPSQKINLSRSLARITLELQSCPVLPEVLARGDWNAFIQEQWVNLETHHHSKKMDPLWLRGLLKFRDQFQIQDFLTASPVFLHADLTYDHFLVEEDQVSAVIDFADCRSGRGEYDLPATLAFIFKGEREALSAYLSELGRLWPELGELKSQGPGLRAPGSSPAKLGEPGLAGDSKLSERLMMWTLLHKYSDLRNYFAIEMNAVPESSKGDFATLSKLVYPIG